MKINQHFKQKRHASQQQKSANTDTIRPREDLISPSASPTNETKTKKRKRVSSRKNNGSPVRQGTDSRRPITGFKFTFPSESTLPSPRTTPSKILKTIHLPLPKQTGGSATMQKLKSVAREDANNRRRLSFESSSSERQSPSPLSDGSTSSFYREVENIMKKFEENEQPGSGMEIEKNESRANTIPPVIHVEQDMQKERSNFDILITEDGDGATNENQQHGLNEISIISPPVILPSLRASSPQIHNNRAESSAPTESARLNAIMEKHELALKGLEKQLVEHMKIHDNKLLSSALELMESRLGPLLEKSVASTIASIGGQLNNLFRSEVIPPISRRYNEAGPNTASLENLQERL